MQGSKLVPATFLALAAGLIAFSSDIAQATARTAIPLQVYTFRSLATPDYDAMVARYQRGLPLFQEILNKQCGLSHVLEIPAPITLDLPASEAKFAWGTSGEVVPSADGFPFQFFQLAVFSFSLKHGPLPGRARGPELSLVMVDHLDGFFGHAIPEIQFNVRKPNATQRGIIRAVKNHVLVAAGPEAQHASFSIVRMIAHELGHLLVQDEPAHHCPEGQQMVPCLGNNLIAAFERLPPEPERPLYKDRGYLDEDRGFGFNDYLAGREVPARGTELLPEQCASVRKTLSALFAE